MQNFEFWAGVDRGRSGGAGGAGKFDDRLLRRVLNSVSEPKESRLR